MENTFKQDFLLCKHPRNVSGKLLQTWRRARSKQAVLFVCLKLNLLVWPIKDLCNKKPFNHIYIVIYICYHYLVWKISGSVTLLIKFLVSNSNTENIQGFVISGLTVCSDLRTLSTFQLLGVATWLKLDGLRWIILSTVNVDFRLFGDSLITIADGFPPLRCVNSSLKDV